MTNASIRFLALACLLPFLGGCAVGLGQVGPRGPLGRPQHAMGFMFGAGFGALAQEQVEGMRDTTWVRQFQPVAEIAYNLPGNVLSVGYAASNAASVDMDRADSTNVGPSKLIFRGWAHGPTAWLRLGSRANLQAKALKLYTHLDDAHADTPAVGEGTRVDVGGMRYEADLNVYTYSSNGLLGVKLGWQYTKADEVTAWGMKRKYMANGPHLIYWMNW